MERRKTRRGSNKKRLSDAPSRDLWLRDRSSGDLAALRHDGFPPLPVPVQPTSVAVPLSGPGRQPLKPPSLCLRGTAADAASDRLGLPRPGQALALSHFSNASRSAPHRTGRSRISESGDGDKECEKFFSPAITTIVPRTQRSAKHFAISAFTRVFDALWRCAAEPGP